MAATFTKTGVWIATATLAGCLMWIYVLTTWPASVERFSDLYPRWYGSRELLLHHRDPYGPDVTREIQEWLHSRPAMAGEDEGRFAYPVYVAFFLSPGVSADFWTVNEVMFWMILAAGAGSAIAYLRFVNWSAPPSLVVTILLFTVFSFPIVFSARARQLAPIVSLAIGCALVCIVARRFFLAGVLMAVATIKPQLTILVVPWLLLWSVAKWRVRRRLVFGFGATAILLCGGSEWFLHGWIREFMQSALAYTRYTDGRSVLQLFFTKPGGMVASAAVVAALGFWCWKWKEADEHSTEFAVATSLVLATTLVIIPTMAPHGQVLLVPGLFVLVKGAASIKKVGGAARYAWLATFLLVAWQWAGALVFVTAVLVLGTAGAHRFWLVPLYASPIVPLFAAVAIVSSARPLLETSNI